MMKARVNFSAAISIALIAAACNSSNATPRADGAAAPAASKSETDAAVTAADKGRIAGDSAAKTWVIIASDFQCPFCRQWHDDSYRQFMQEYVRSGKVKVAYINFPLGQHQNAVPTAQAAMCASAQNKFWQYHDALFDTQKQWESMPEPRPVLDSIAKVVGVDFPKWSKCVDTDQMLQLVFADRDRAAAAGVRSTPSFLVGAQIVAGSVPMAELRPILDSAIAKNGSAPPR